jgi:hypothetical protein
MANEILPAGVGDLTTTETMAAEYLMLLAERDGSVLMHPALLYASAPNPTSNVVKVRHIGLGGYDLLSATTPGSEVANTALSDGSTDVTVAMRAKRYNLDDLGKYMIGGVFDAAMWAADAVVSVLIAHVTDDFSSTAGTSGVNASWQDVVDAKTLLAVAKAGGSLLGLVHPQQWGDLETDAIAIGMALPETARGVVAQGLGSSYKGTYFGIDFYASSSVPTADAGANRAGGIFARGGVAWADAQIPDEGDSNILNLGRARFERVRQGHFLATSWITSYACGVAKAIDGAGVTLKTDA